MSSWNLIYDRAGQHLYGKDTYHVHQQHRGHHNKGYGVRNSTKSIKL